jgi:pimeloyl-ACP methyl ester carboxylesterase
MDLRPSLSHIRCPTLVIHGADDHAILPENGATIAASIAGRISLRLTAPRTWPRSSVPT